MNARLQWAVLVSVFWFSSACFSQTNSSSPGFSTNHVDLGERTLAKAVADTFAAPDFHLTPLNIATPPVTLAAADSGFNSVTYTRQELEAFDRLTRDREMWQARATDPMRRFYPVPIRFRHLAVSCSVYTAIKQRNPFCLINPVPFQINF